MNCFAVSLVDDVLPLRAVLENLGATELLRLEYASAGLTERIRAVKLNTLWCTLCASEGIRVPPTEQVQALKTIYRGAVAFQGNAWDLSSEEAQLFIDASQHACAAKVPGLGLGIRVSFCFTPEEAVMLNTFLVALRGAPPLPEDDEFTARASIQMHLDLKPFEQARSVQGISSTLLEAIDGTAFLEIRWEANKLQVGVSVWLACDIDEEDPSLDLHGFKDIDRLLLALERQRFRCFAVDHVCRKQGMLINAGDGGHIGAWWKCKTAEDQQLEIPLGLSALLDSLVECRPVRCLLIPQGKKQPRLASSSQHRQRGYLFGT